MASYNRVVLLGNLTRDVELKYTPSQVAIAKIGLAVNDRVKKNNEWVDETTFVDITFFGRTAEVAGEYLNKGSQILIEGRLRYETWESEGQKRSKLSVVGDKLQMLGSRSGGGGPNARPASAGAGVGAGVNADPNEYDSSAVHEHARDDEPDVPF